MSTSNDRRLRVLVQAVFHQNTTRTPAISARFDQLRECSRFMAAMPGVPMAYELIPLLTAL
ncbi:MAG: hypothetical protein KAZ48_10330 [Candidatus Nanopelagicales bacterium]|nr:hypothetical protein [Candidatus Nanopelagicales bacterium]